MILILVIIFHADINKGIGINKEFKVFYLKKNYNFIAKLYNKSSICKLYKKNCFLLIISEAQEQFYIYLSIISGNV